MKNLLTLAIVGGGIYLAYDLLSTKKKNQAAAVVGGAKPDNAILAAEAQEEGMEGEDVVVSLEQQGGTGMSELKSGGQADLNFNGWDSDTISKGF